MEAQNFVKGFCDEELLCDFVKKETERDNYIELDREREIQRSEREVGV